MDGTDASTAARRSRAIASIAARAQPEHALHTSRSATSTSFTDSGLTNGTTYYYKVSAVNSNGEGPLSNEASATPTDLVPPAEPLPTVDCLQPSQREPALGRGALVERCQSAPRDGSPRHDEPARLLADDDLHGLAQRGAVRARRRGPGLASRRFPERTTSFVCIVRLSQAGAGGSDGYMLRTNQQTGDRPGPARAAEHRRRSSTRLTIPQELAAGDTLLLRAKGTAIEAWRHDGAGWARLGVVQDSTYSGRRLRRGRHPRHDRSRRRLRCAQSESEPALSPNRALRPRR